MCGAGPHRHPVQLGLAAEGLAADHGAAHQAQARRPALLTHGARTRERGDGVDQLAVVAGQRHQPRHTRAVLEAGGGEVRGAGVAAPLPHQRQGEGGVQQVLGRVGQREVLGQADELQVGRQHARQLRRRRHPAEVVVEQRGAAEEAETLLHDQLPQREGRGAGRAVPGPRPGRGRHLGQVQQRHALPGRWTVAEVWPERGGPAGRGGEHDQCDVGEEHEPQDVIVLDVAGGERGGTLAVEEAGQGEGEGDEEAEKTMGAPAPASLAPMIITFHTKPNKD